MICDDLLAISREWSQSTVYPPYLQMLIDYIWRAKESGAAQPFTFASYQQARRIDGIVGNYLKQQLSYANDETGNLSLLLVALVRSYGTKAQRSLLELAADTGIDSVSCESQLEQLIDLRLVRHIRDLYEVSHDFLARMILDKLVDREERDFKRFRELLGSRASAFASTSSRLTVDEALLLYKHRARIVLNDEEGRLILDTWLREDVPGLTWLLAVGRDNIAGDLSAYKQKSLSAEEWAFAVILKVILGLEIGPADILSLIGSYKVSFEAGRLIKRYWRVVPKEAIWRGLTQRRAEIREACFDAVCRQVSLGNLDLIRSLRAKAGPQHQRAYLRLASDKDVPSLPAAISVGRVLYEFFVLQNAVRGTGSVAMREVQRYLQEGRPRAIVKDFLRSVARIRKNRIQDVLHAIRVRPLSKVGALVAALEATSNPEWFPSLANFYLELNHAEGGRIQKPAIAAKASMIAGAVRAACCGSSVDKLREVLHDSSLHGSSRAIALAVFEQGTLDDMLEFVRKVSDSPAKVHYENHMEFCETIRRRLRTEPAVIPTEMLALLRARDFWTYVSVKERRSAEPGTVLPLRNIDNRPFFLRLSAHIMIGLSRSPNTDILGRLVVHNYRSISRAAAVRLVELTGEAALLMVAGKIDQAVSSDDRAALAAVIRQTELALYERDLWERCEETRVPKPANVPC